MKSRAVALFSYRRNPRRVLGCLLVALLVAAALVSVRMESPLAAPVKLAANCSPSNPSASIGIALGGEIMSEADLRRALNSAVSLGVKRVRIGMDWSDIEPAPGVYNWARYDALVSGARAGGLTVLGVLLTTPVWARDPGALGEVHSLPARASDFGAFAAAAANHFNGQVPAWEIWNEPNVREFAAPAPSVARFADMMSAAAAGIRSVNANATIITGGLAPAGDNNGQIAPVTFLSQLYSIGNRASWTAVGMHPYTFPFLPNDPGSAAWNAYQRMSLMYNTMSANGDGGKLIWMTEFGAPTSATPDGVSEQVQSQSISQAIGGSRSTSYLGPLFIHSLRDAGTNSADREQNFGLLRNDWSQKPSYQTVSDLARSCS